MLCLCLKEHPKHVVLKAKPKSQKSSAPPALTDDHTSLASRRAYGDVGDDLTDLHDVVALAFFFVFLNMKKQKKTKNLFLFFYIFVFLSCFVFFFL